MYICVLLQCLTTAFLLVPYFLCDVLYPGFQHDYADPTFDIAVKFILFFLSNILGLLMQ